ncbi:hypothetical protein GBF38_010619, partial [Nibea albiflora]
DVWDTLCIAVSSCDGLDSAAFNLAVLFRPRGLTVAPRGQNTQRSLWSPSACFSSEF